MNSFSLLDLTSFLDKTLILNHAFLIIRRNANSGVTPERNAPFSFVRDFTIDIWNGFAKSHGLKTIISIAKGSEREKHFKARNEEPMFDFPLIIDMAEGQPFCFGNNDRNWKLSFDWLIKNPGNYIQILEGKYLDDEQKKKEFKLEENENDPY